MTLPEPKNYSREWVDNPASLKRAVTAVGKAERIYFDLEADSMHHYYAKICLMQVLAGDTCYAIDPLAGLDLKPLLAVLALKPLVLHGADYDLRMLYQQFRFRPKEIFDTMIAAQLLSRTSFGLAALVKEFFGITLGKEAQKADWSRRPLPESMLEYAVQDTFFLPSLHEALALELKVTGRQEWHRESCEALIRATERIRETDPDAVWRLAGSARYAPRQLAALKAQWDYRESLAQARDVPGYKILPSEILLRFADAVPREGHPELIPRLPSRLDPDVHDGFVRVYNEAISADPKEWPKPIAPPRKPIKSPHPDLLADLRKVRDSIASGLKLDPSLLAPRAVMLAVALTGLYSSQEVREAAQWMPWQEKLLLEPWLQAAQRYQKPH